MAAKIPLSVKMLAVILCAISQLAGEENALRRTAGTFQVLLRLPPNGLFPGEEMEIEARIEESGKPVVRAQVEVQIDMPSMPGMPAYKETAHSEGVAGEYGVHPTFAHGGEYRLRLNVTAARETAFEIEFPVQVLDVKQSKGKLRPARYSVEVATNPKRPKAGEFTEMRFMFRDRENSKAAVVFETVHEALFHLVMVRRDLSEFAHEHPTLDGDGVFRLRYRFPEAGEYRLFADVAPKGAGSQVLPAKVVVTGAASVKFEMQSAPRSRV